MTHSSGGSSMYDHIRQMSQQRPQQAQYGLKPKTPEDASHLPGAIQAAMLPAMTEGLQGSENHLWTSHVLFMQQ